MGSTTDLFGAMNADPPRQVLRGPQPANPASKPLREWAVRAHRSIEPDVDTGERRL